MAGIRIYELSKKIKVSSKDIMAKLAELGIEVKSHMSNITADTENKLTDIFLKQPPLAEEKPAPSMVKEKEAKPATPADAKTTKEAVKTEEKSPADKLKQKKKEPKPSAALKV